MKTWFYFGKNFSGRKYGFGFQNPSFMKYYILAGEASGDLHGANLVRALKLEDPAAQVRAWGGGLMSEAGAEVVKHYRELAFMGFVEVVKNLPAIARNFRECKSGVLQFQPDVLILIDYPGFNLRMAKWAKKQGIRVFYYISPQLWAWHTSRVKIVVDTVERMFVILPFEKEFYEKHGVEVEFPGHPLLDVVDNQPDNAGFFQKNNLPEGKPIVALLPGSRRQEIERMLEVMAAVAPAFPGYQFVVAGAPSIGRAFYREVLPDDGGVRIVENQTYALLQHATAALVTSGTATLETALFNVPQVVCYRGEQVSYWLAKRLVNKDLKFIAIVNLIAGRELVKELIQEDLTAGERREKILAGYRELRQILGEPGASRRAAAAMVRILKRKKS
jgi:lipid-A-disaccharide synthase